MMKAMTVAEGLAIGLGFLAIVAPDFWPRMPRLLSYFLAAIGLAWLTYSGILAAEDFNHMKLQNGPLVLIIAGALLIAGGLFWHINRINPNKSKSDQPTTSPAVTSQPSLFRVVNIEFFPPQSQPPLPARARYSIANVGGMSASHFLKVPAYAISDGLLDREKEDQFFNIMPLIPPLEADGGNEFQPGEGGAFWTNLDGVTQDVYNEILAGKKRLYMGFKIAYRDEATPLGQRRMTETCRSYSGTLTEGNWCTGHNRTYLID